MILSRLAPITALMFFICGFRSVEAADLKVLKVDADGGDLQVQAAIRSAPLEELEFRVSERSSETGFNMSPTPINLWILIDNSSMCSDTKLDKYLNSLFSKLPQKLSSESLVSVVTFTQENTVVMANHTSVKGLADIKIECQQEARSTSFEGALTQLLSQSKKSNLPTQAWIYSSGNVAMSANTARQVQEREMNLRVALYVPMVLPQIQPLLKLNTQLLGDRFLHEAIDTGSKAGPTLPELEFEGRFSPSRSNQGSTAAFRLSAYKRGKEPVAIASASFHALVPNPWYKKLLPFAQGAAILLSLGLLFILFKTYRPKKCSTCSKTLKFSHSECRFCHAHENPSVIVTEDSADAQSHPQTTILPLLKGSATIYKTRYGYSTQGRKAQALLRIEKRLSGDRHAFAVAPVQSHATKHCSSLLNGRAFLTPRFLASGDTLRIGSTSLSFVAGEKS